MDRIRRLTATWAGKLVALVIMGIVGLLLIQLIPVPRTNPAVTAEVNWDTPETRALAVRACFDCHSNEVTYPWYSKVAPVSWLIYRDVHDGRRALNFSDWSTRREGEFAEAINGGEMPPWYYTVMHPNAKLSDTEKQQLITGLYNTIGQTVGAATGSGN